MRSLFILLLLSSCTVTTRYGYAPCKITHYKGSIHVQPTGKVKPMPDTTVYGYIIKRY